MVGHQVLEDPQGRWRIETVIPLPDPFGLAVSTPLGMVCLGGRAGRAASSAVYRLNWEKGRVRVASLPDLPQACAYPAGAAVGATVYVAGGGVPSAGTAGGRNFWALDLRKTPLGWRSLPAWPGPARLLAAGGGQDGSFFLFGGLAQSVPLPKLRIRSSAEARPSPRLANPPCLRSTVRRRTTPSPITRSPTPGSTWAPCHSPRVQTPRSFGGEPG